MIWRKVTSYWRSLPTHRRVMIIASVILVFAAPEAIVYAAPAMDLALVIDAFGLGFAFALFYWNGTIGLRLLWASAMEKTRALARWYEDRRDPFDRVYFILARILGGIRLATYGGCAAVLLLVFGQQALHALIHLHR